MRSIVCFKQKTAYEMRISDWSSDVCSSDLVDAKIARREFFRRRDLGIEQFGGHRTAGYDAEPAGVADRADEMAFRNPAHRSAENGVIAAETLGPARHQVVQFPPRQCLCQHIVPRAIRPRARASRHRA